VLAQLAENGVEADAVLLDLGVSSMQIDRPERGFSYAVDAPLDMRMDPSADVTAAGIVNEAAERDLATIFKRYGEERYARQIARAVVRRRKEQRFVRTGDLVETIKAAIPAPARFGDGHPAKRVFQALRIAVNAELDGLDRLLEEAARRLLPGGRIAVIAFHSLEDRIVKTTLRDMTRRCICPRDLPVCGCGRPGILRVVTPKAVRPQASEIDANPRSRSARLRAYERLESAA
jgi:16S rRNA (cytosine1402-N4)-methyltransferase